LNFASGDDQATLSASRLPHALTYLRSVATDGECFPVAGTRSSRRRRRLGTHALCHLRLRQARALARHEQGIEQRGLLALKTLDLCTDAGRCISFLTTRS